METKAQRPVTIAMPYAIQTFLHGVVILAIRRQTDKIEHATAAAYKMLVSQRRNWA